MHKRVVLWPRSSGVPSVLELSRKSRLRVNSKVLKPLNGQSGVGSIYFSLINERCHIKIFPSILQDFSPAPTGVKN